MRLISIFSITLILFSQFGFTQECDTTLKPKKDSIYGYKERENRCEGFYISDVAIADIDVVSVLQGKLFYDLDKEESVEISSLIVKDKTIYIKAQAIPLKIYYRMDAKLPPNSTLEWPINDVILPNNLSNRTIGLLGWYMSNGKQIYVPLKTKAEISSLKNDDVIRIIFRSTVDVEQIHHAWISYETQKSTGWQKNLMSTCRAGMPIVINLKHEAKGRQLLLIAAKVMNEEDKWVKKTIDMIVR